MTSSIYQTITSRWFKPSPPRSCIYEERIKCFEKLAEIQKNLKCANEEYANISPIEGETHQNALNRIKCITKDYKKEYELCEKIIKY